MSDAVLPLLHLPAQDFGRRLEVWWPGEREWFAGRVTGYNANTRRHTIRYDDGDVERVYLPGEQYRCLPAAMHTPAVLGPVDNACEMPALATVHFALG